MNVYFSFFLSTDWVDVANDLLSKCHVNLRLKKLTDCNADVFIALYENILGEKVPGKKKLQIWQMSTFTFFFKQKCKNVSVHTFVTQYLEILTCLMSIDGRAWGALLLQVIM